MLDDIDLLAYLLRVVLRGVLGVFVSLGLLLAAELLLLLRQHVLVGLLPTVG